MSVFYEFQIDIIKALQSVAQDWITAIVEAITMLGEEYIAIAIIALVFFFFNKKLAYKMIFLVAGSMTFNATIKNFVKEPRPHEMSSDVVDMRHADGYSFPSGHSQMTGTWLTGFAHQLYLEKKVKWGYIISSILTVLVMMSRMYLGQHFLVDVLVGGILGIGGAIGLSYLYDYYANKNKEATLLSLVTIVFIPFAIYFLLTSNVNMDKGYDFFKMYGLFVGLLLAFVFENKYVNFDHNVNIGKKLLRVVGAVICLLAVKEGLGALFKMIALACIAQGEWGYAVFCVLHFIRYMLLVFVCMGVYPLLFKKLKF